MKAGNDIMVTSQQIRGKPFSFFVKGYLATLVSWAGRFLVANLIILAIGGQLDHLLVFSRQVVMFVCMSVSPTPGGSGVAELSFSTFLAEFIPLKTDAQLTLLWRLITFYPYLLIGAILLPRWVRWAFGSKRK